MLDLTPDPIAFRLGPVPVHWYGIAYAVGLAAVYILLTWLARRAGRNHEILGNGFLVVVIAALLGGRLYHVIDQWELYRNNLPSIILPPYSGLGVYGGIATGTVAAWLYARYVKEPFWTWADIVAPGLFLMQGIGRWGNFFNQELYGPPTTVPWGIPIDCTHRLAQYACGPVYGDATRFHPLFLYESLSGLLGAAFLVFLFLRARHRLRPGSLLFIFFIWYGVVRFALEALRENNWVVFGIPTAQLVSVAFITVGIVGLVLRNRGGGRNEEPEGSPEPAPERREPLDRASSERATSTAPPG